MRSVKIFHHWLLDCLWFMKEVYREREIFRSSALVQFQKNYFIRDGVVTARGIVCTFFYAFVGESWGQDLLLLLPQVTVGFEKKEKESWMVLVLNSLSLNYYLLTVTVVAPNYEGNLGPWALGLGCGKRALILLQEHTVTMGKTLLVKQNRLSIKPNFADCLLDLPNWIVSVHCPIYWFIGKLFLPFFLAFVFIIIFF